MRGGFTIEAGCSKFRVLPDAPTKQWSQLKILHIIGSLSPAEGGPPEAVRQLVKAYIEVGAAIEVVCLDDPSAPFLADISRKVHALGERYLGRYCFSPRLWRWLHRNAQRFDGIVMNGIWPFPGIAMRSAARQVKTPYGVFVHGALDPWFNRRYPLKHLKKWIYWPVQHAVLHEGDGGSGAAELCESVWNEPRSDCHQQGIWGGKIEGQDGTDLIFNLRGFSVQQDELATHKLRSVNAT